jgi:hypothetical protein
MPQPPSRAFPHSALQASLETRQARADARATNLAPLIAELQAAGVTSQRAIAKVLNARGVLNPKGRRSVARVAGLAAAEAAAGLAVAK